MRGLKKETVSTNHLFFCLELKAAHISQPECEVWRRKRRLIHPAIRIIPEKDEFNFFKSTFSCWETKPANADNEFTLSNRSFLSLGRNSNTFQMLLWPLFSHTYIPVLSPGYARVWGFLRGDHMVFREIREGISLHQECIEKWPTVNCIWREGPQKYCRALWGDQVNFIVKHQNPPVSLFPGANPRLSARVASEYIDI